MDQEEEEVVCIDLMDLSKEKQVLYRTLNMEQDEEDKYKYYDTFQLPTNDLKVEFNFKIFLQDRVFLEGKFKNSCILHIVCLLLLLLRYRNLQIKKNARKIPSTI